MLFLLVSHIIHITVEGVGGGILSPSDFVCLPTDKDMIK